MAYGKITKKIELSPFKFFGLFGGDDDEADRLQGEVDAQKENFESQVQAIEDFQFKNAFAGMGNPYANQVNMMGLLGVNSQQAQFEAQQQTANQAQALNALRGAAGSSGVASLAQAMANQQAINTQRSAASIGAQEAQNSRMRAQEASRIQQSIAQGQMQVNMAKAQGEMTLQGLEYGQQQSLLNIAAEQYGSAQLGLQQYEADQAQMGGAVGSLFGTVAGAIIGGPAGAQIGGGLGGTLGTIFS
tara:strand:+ start:9529 stop:10263 length:735 start_codon:yes stop_codon:yes gene_type:complete